MNRTYRLEDYKIAFFDLDGTLLNSQGVTSPATRAAIRVLKDAGLRISLATGRASFGCAPVVEALNVCDPCVFFSGGLVINPADESVLFEAHLDPAEVREITSLCRELGIHEELYNSKTYFIETPGPLADLHAEYMGHYPQVGNLDTVTASEKLLKLTLVAEGGEKEAILRNMQKSFPSLNFHIACGATAPNVWFSNITNPLASRENAFHTVLDHFGLEPSEAIAFGDASSDIPFLKMSALGIALGNAEKSVKDIADFVTTAIDEEGIQHAVEALFNVRCTL